MNDEAAGRADRPREAHYVQSLARGLSVITVFGPESPELTLSDVARATGLTRAAARRFLLTLVDLGYVRTDGKMFGLTPRVLDLGYAYLSSLSLPAVAEPHLEWLVHEVGESSSMSVLDGGDIVYVARVPTSRIMTVSINVGTRFPAYATSMGRVLLAGLEPEELEDYLGRTATVALTDHTIHHPDRLRRRIAEVRGQGYEMVDQELEAGLRSIAVPIRNRRDRVVAAINSSSHVSRLTEERARGEFLPLLRECAGRIERDLHRI